MGDAYRQFVIMCVIDAVVNILVISTLHPDSWHRVLGTE